MYLLDPATLSISADFTTTLSCFAIAEESVEPPPGSSLSKENTCSVLCPVGTYQPDVQKSSCLPCPSDSTPKWRMDGWMIVAHWSICSNTCSPASNNQTICPTNANCFLMASTNRCECKSAFTPVPPDSPTDFDCTDRCENFFGVISYSTISHVCISV